MGNCLDLTDSESLLRLKMAYDTLQKTLSLSGLPLPKNEDPLHVKPRDRVLRKLDCAVIEKLHELNRQANLPPFDSVRGVFWEGEELYPNAGFMQKNHIQIAIINPNCIKGFSYREKLILSGLIRSALEIVLRCNVWTFIDQIDRWSLRRVLKTIGTANA